jgi:sugar phosphate isomerase/epimerase
MSVRQFGISTHLYHHERLSRDHLVEIAAHGFEAVEIFANRPHLDATDVQVLDELADAVKDTRLHVRAVHAPIADSLQRGTWGTPFSIACSDEAARTSAVEAIEQALGLASAIPFEFLVVHLGVPEARQPARTDNQRDAVRRSLEALHESASRAGVRLALEVMPNALSTPEALVTLIEEDLELPGVAICLDVGHAFLMAGDVADAIETVSGHLVTTHLHDNRGRTDDHLVPFEGRVDWDSTLMTLQKVGYDGALMFELAGTDDARAALERAAKARERMEQILVG